MLLAGFAARLADRDNAMPVLVLSIPPILLSVLLAVGGWLVGILLWMLVGKFEELSRKIGARPYSAERFASHLFGSLWRGSSSRRKGNVDGLVR